MAKKNYVGLQAINVGFEGHLTLIYTGDMTKKMENTYQQIIDSFPSKVPMKYKVFNLDRRSIEMFGPNNDIPVIRLFHHSALNDLREYLLATGIPNRSDFDFNPHITIKAKPYETIEIPPKIRLVGLGLY